MKTIEAAKVLKRFLSKNPARKTMQEYGIEKTPNGAIWLYASDGPTCGAVRVGSCVPGGGYRMAIAPADVGALEFDAAGRPLTLDVPPTPNHVPWRSLWSNVEDPSAETNGAAVVGDEFQAFLQEIRSVVRHCAGTIASWKLQRLNSPRGSAEYDQLTNCINRTVPVVRLRPSGTMDLFLSVPGAADEQYKTGRHPFDVSRPVIFDARYIDRMVGFPVTTAVVDAGFQSIGALQAMGPGIVAIVGGMRY